MVTVDSWPQEVDPELYVPPTANGVPTEPFDVHSIKLPEPEPSIGAVACGAPDCDKTLTSNAARGAHRWRAHGIRGTSARRKPLVADEDDALYWKGKYEGLVAGIKLAWELDSTGANPPDEGQGLFTFGVVVHISHVLENVGEYLLWCSFMSGGVVVHATGKGEESTTQQRHTQQSSQMQQDNHRDFSILNICSRHRVNTK